jgi:hypothetical protein
MVGFLEILKAVSLENRNEKKLRIGLYRLKPFYTAFRGGVGYFSSPHPVTVIF